MTKRQTAPLDYGTTAEKLKGALLREETTRPGVALSGVRKDANALFTFLQAELLLREDNYEAAEQAYEEALRLSPEEAPVIRKRLVQLYLRSGKVESAKQELEQILTSDRTDNELLRLYAGLLAAEKNFAAATKLYEELMNRTPDNQDNYIFLASLQADHGEVSAAIATLQKLVKRIPDSVLGYYYLARIYQSTGNYKDSDRYYLEALKINPGSESIQLDRARELVMQGKTEQAISICRELIKTNPHNTSAREFLTQLFWQGKKYNEALGELKALQDAGANPNEVRLRIALINLEKQEYEAAITELSLVLAEEPEQSRARYFLASALVATNRASDALQELDKIKSDQAMYLESRMLGSYISAKNKDYPRAINFINAARQKYPENKDLLGYLVTLQQQSGDRQGALETANKLIEVDPTNELNLFNLGYLYDQQGDRVKALATMQRVIAINPKHAAALNFIGYALAEEGKDLVEAEKLVRRALEIEPKNGYYLDSLAWVYYHQAKYKKAKETQLKALELVPDDAVLLEHLAEIELKLGNSSTAQELFKRALQAAPQSEDRSSIERIEKRLESLDLR
ncbi:tetratricopeptide repeat protein [bacterium]|nr:tetratricopeptide repeat protein [bacterium]